MSPRLLFVRHPGLASSGTFPGAARAAGWTTHEWCPAHEAPPDPPPEAWDAVCVLGGEMNVHETDEHPYLLDELALLERLLAREVPVLGVCLGAQLLGAAAGGRVVRIPEPEIGWYDVRLLPAAGGDPVLGVADASFAAFQWHGYAVVPPRGSLALARSDVCLQAFRTGPRAWGVQFHSEVTPEIVTRWVTQDRSDAAVAAVGPDPRATLAEWTPRLPAWTAFGRALLTAFLRAAERPA